MSNVKSVYSQLASVRKSVDGYIKKDTNVNGQYNAVSHDKVMRIARQAFIDNDVIVSPTLIDDSTDITKTESKDSNGNIKIKSKVYYTAKYSIDFISCTDGSVHSIVFSSHSEDYGDKAPGKALSYAVKYALMKILMLETGDKDEERPKDNPISDTQCSIVRNKLDNCGYCEKIEPVLLEAAKCDSIEELTNFDWSINFIIACTNRLIQKESK